MTTALAKQDLNLSQLDVIMRIAPVMKASRLFGVATDEQAAAVMIKGYELGFSLSASFEFVTVIQNKPVLVPKGMMALIMNSPVYESHKIEEKVDAKGNPVSCTVTMKRKGGFGHTVTFSMADATRAGLIKEGGAWETYPANMLRWRALGYCADIVFPDVIGGMKRADEFGAMIDQDGEIVDAEVIAPPAPAPVQAQVVEQAPVKALPTLQELLAQYGPDKILAANNGKIPGSDEEIAAVVASLEAS